MRPLLLSLLLLAGCGSLQDQYVEADKATFNAITPAYLNYVAQDETLDERKRARRLATVESWRARLKEAEGGE